MIGMMKWTMHPITYCIQYTHLIANLRCQASNNIYYHCTVGCTPFPVETQDCDCERPNHVETKWLWIIRTQKNNTVLLQKGKQNGIGAIWMLLQRTYQALWTNYHAHSLKTVSSVHSSCHAWPMHLQFQAACIHHCKLSSHGEEEQWYMCCMRHTTLILSESKTESLSRWMLCKSWSWFCMVEFGRLGNVWGLTM